MQYTIQPPTGAVVQVLLYLLWKNNAEEEVQTDEKENFNDTFKEKNFLEWQKHDHNAKKRFKKKGIFCRSHNRYYKKYCMKRCFQNAIIAFENFYLWNTYKKKKNKTKE